MGVSILAGSLAFVGASRTGAKTKAASGPKAANFRREEKSESGDLTLCSL